MHVSGAFGLGGGGTTERYQRSAPKPQPITRSAGQSPQQSAALGLPALAQNQQPSQEMLGAIVVPQTASPQAVGAVPSPAPQVNAPSSLNGESPFGESDPFEGSSEPDPFALGESVAESEEAGTSGKRFDVSGLAMGREQAQQGNQSGDAPVDATAETESFYDKRVERRFREKAEFNAPSQALRGGAMDMDMDMDRNADVGMGMGDAPFGEVEKSTERNVDRVDSLKQIELQKRRSLSDAATRWGIETESKAKAVAPVQKGKSIIRIA